MTRKRIHELAKKWGVTPQAILAQLEKIGITRKTGQSFLTEDEAEKVKVRLGLTPASMPVVGTERLVAERVVVQQAEGTTQSITTKEQAVRGSTGACDPWSESEREGQWGRGHQKTAISAQTRPHTCSHRTWRTRGTSASCTKNEEGAAQHGSETDGADRSKGEQAGDQGSGDHHRGGSRQGDVSYG